ncbi:MAG: RNA-guided endonuclease IscB, partial [Methanosarcinales archaeon]
MLVYVLNKHNQPLMPCSPRKARVLLKEGKVKIVDYEPFTIQLLYGSSGYRQETVLGIDPGSKKIGIVIVTEEGKVLYQSEIELRQDIHKNMETRKALRRARRYRKTRYRKARFNNRKKPKGWLPPSLNSKVNVIVGMYDRLSKIIPITRVVVEIAKFDTQKLQNPNISGNQYQQGNTYGYYNVRHYVFARDRYTCQICKKRDNRPLITHHVIQRSKGGTDRPDNLITLHADCHIKYHQGKHPNVKFNTLKQYKEAAHVTAMKNKIVELLKARTNTSITFGNITKATRIKFNLKKHHYTDAIAITGIYPKKPLDVLYKIRQVRKKKRSLHEQIPRKGRKEP